MESQNETEKQIGDTREGKEKEKQNERRKGIRKAVQILVRFLKPCSIVNETNFSKGHVATLKMRAACSPES